MPYDFWIPAEPDNWVKATLEEDGQLTFHDYDLEFDIGLEALGVEPSLALQTALLWRDDPIGLLCGKHRLIPRRDNGLAAWSWAHLAVGEAFDERAQRLHPEIHASLENSLKAAFSALTKKRLPFKKLLVARRDISTKTPPEIPLSHRWFGMRDQRGEADAMRAVKTLLKGILEHVLYEEFSGRPSQSTRSFCDVGTFALQVLEYSLEDTRPHDQCDSKPYYDRLIEAAVATMGDVQEASGGLHRNPEQEQWHSVF